MKKGNTMMGRWVLAFVMLVLLVGCKGKGEKEEGKGVEAAAVEETEVADVEVVRTPCGHVIPGGKEEGGAVTGEGDHKGCDHGHKGGCGCGKHGAVAEGGGCPGAANKEGGHGHEGGCGCGKHGGSGHEGMGHGGGEGVAVAGGGSPCGGHAGGANHVVMGKGELPPLMEPGQRSLYGGEFTIAEEPVTLVEAVKGLESNKGDAIKLKAKIDKVCTRRGCWMTLSDPALTKTVRVKMKDYAFFMPRNANGGSAVLEGVLTMKKLPKEVLEHYASETAGGEEIKGIEDGLEYEFMATAVEITMPQA